MSSGSGVGGRISGLSVRLPTSLVGWSGTGFDETMVGEFRAGGGGGGGKASSTSIETETSMGEVEVGLGFKLRCDRILEMLFGSKVGVLRDI